jgi:hypothetical protein
MDKSQERNELLVAQEDYEAIYLSLSAASSFPGLISWFSRTVVCVGESVLILGLVVLPITSICYQR